MAKVKEEKAKLEIRVPKPDFKYLQVTIIGDTPINIHRLGKKMQQEFDDRDHGKPKPKKINRDYDKEFIDSLYYIDENGNEIPEPQDPFKKGVRYGFPSSAFKKAMVFAARQFDNLKMTELRGRFFVNLDRPFVEIKGKPEMEKFWRRIGGKGPGTGTPDIGIRAVIKNWSATLTIKYLANVITAESLMNLLSAAGFSVGVGEDRPDKSGGSYGCWHIEESD